MIENGLPDGSLLGLRQDLALTHATASRAGQQCVPPPACHFVQHLSTAFTDTLNRAATSTRSRPSTSADTASNRAASCASGDQARASPTRSLTHCQQA
ncbi:hypothetical protein [Streptomyces flavovirens]|uniref:hypothetical protein n=1 Tax=Streptomyces flavovirens TaxID=52258 RepID=UPI003384426B